MKDSKAKTKQTTEKSEKLKNSCCKENHYDKSYRQEEYGSDYFDNNSKISYYNQNNEENLAKSNLKIAQSNNRRDDYGIDNKY